MVEQISMLDTPAAVSEPKAAPPAPPVPTVQFPAVAMKSRHREILVHMRDGARMTFGVRGAPGRTAHPARVPETGMLTKGEIGSVIKGAAIQKRTRDEMLRAGWIEVAPDPQRWAVTQLVITEEGRSSLAAALAGPPRTPITPEQRDLITRLGRCSFLPGSFDKRFVADLQTATDLTPRMAECLAKVVHRYRRQLEGRRQPQRRFPR